jgi:hypothetical protein
MKKIKKNYISYYRLFQPLEKKIRPQKSSFYHLYFIMPQKYFLGIKKAGKMISFEGLKYIFSRYEKLIKLCKRFRPFMNVHRFSKTPMKRSCNMVNGWERPGIFEPGRSNALERTSGKRPRSRFKNERNTVISLDLY